ncbi:MAG TPA: group 1 truncated hemoglobin [Thermoanaerobaculia bacterium]|nr:group 1 truncated hemoglobin [Thermoanaerobaculia bacterium]
MRTKWTALVLAIAISACAHQRSLYDRIGGTPVLSAIVDSFIARFADDTRVAPTFAKTDIPKFRKLILEQFCNITGGGCKYTGRDMKTTHEGLHLTEAQFNALVEDLQDAMATQRVPIELQNELIAKLAPMRADIIHR